MLAKFHSCVILLDVKLLHRKNIALYFKEPVDAKLF